MQLKRAWEKFWFLLWKDNSVKGWIFSLLFLFIFIKFIFFPLLSLATGTSLPLAIVESCSMYHKSNLFQSYDAWWQDHEDNYDKFNIDKEEFDNFIFTNGFNKGDILFIVGANPDKLKTGDIIIFNAQQRNPVIHRIIDIETTASGKVFTTMGDNVGLVQFFEEEIRENDLVGKAVFKIAPYVGWGKLIFFEFSKPQSERGLCVQR
jgi:signal peptidase I